MALHRRNIPGQDSSERAIDSAAARGNTYSILLWRFQHLSPTSRWYPVFERYLSYIAGRINAMGGNAGAIIPSPGGVPSQGHGVQPKPKPKPIGLHTEDVTGKVAGIVYDRFGDFEGFLLMTESGHERAFHSTEAEIEALVRFAWLERIVVRVLVHNGQLSPFSIILFGRHGISEHER